MKKANDVYAIPTGSDYTEGGILVGHASSKTGAIQACRQAGHRVMTKGGCIEQSYDKDGPDIWCVSIYDRGI
jgi:hypothetical protein